MFGKDKRKENLYIYQHSNFNPQSSSIGQAGIKVNKDNNTIKRDLKMGDMNKKLCNTR